MSRQVSAAGVVRVALSCVGRGLRRVPGSFPRSLGGIRARLGDSWAGWTVFPFSAARSYLRAVRS